MNRYAHLAVFAMLIALGAVPVMGAGPASVTGIVRDSSGVPQIGAEVQLLRPDLTVLTRVYTDGAGRFAISSLQPGRYAIKAMGPYFLPSLRENIRVKGAVVVNLTLNTLYEAIQWLPAQPRIRDTQKDDWTWTLRSAANRPLLRWLEDGPLVVVSDGPGVKPKLMARLMATGQAGTFGESGERFSATVEDTPADSRELLARVDFAPDSDAGMESMLGFRQDLGYAGSVESVAAITVEPEVGGAGDRGLQIVTLRSSETMNLGPAIHAEVGSAAVTGRLGGSASTVEMLPFADVEWSGKAQTVRYRITTMAQNPFASEDESAASELMTAVAKRDGRLTFEHGMHQEIGWQRETNTSQIAVVFFSDQINNSVLEAMGHFAGSGSAATETMLYDPASQLLRTAGPSFSSTGVGASLERVLPGENRVRVSYASGSALAMPAAHTALPLAEVLTVARPRRVQTYSIALSGTIDGTQTQWRASYRWQPDDIVTTIAPFASNMAAPYLNLKLSQPIRITREGTSGFEAMIDVRNLLAEGYRPYLLSDGSLLLFAADRRSLQAGLAFNF